MVSGVLGNGGSRGILARADSWQGCFFFGGGGGYWEIRAEEILVWRDFGLGVYMVEQNLSGILDSGILPGGYSPGGFCH